jgi:hypothetical protein
VKESLRELLEKIQGMRSGAQEEAERLSGLAKYHTDRAAGFHAVGDFRRAGIEAQMSTMYSNATLMLQVAAFQMSVAVGDSDGE